MTQRAYISISRPATRENADTSRPQPARHVSDRPWLLSETTWKIVASTPYEVAVLPWGATEAHNFHLPYGTDTVHCESVAARAAQRAWKTGARVTVLPAVPFGVQTGQLDIPLCINMNPATQAALLADVAGSLERQGVPKLVVLNGHGGNDFRQMIRELQPRTHVFLCAVDWYRIVDPGEYFEDLGDHAGEMETSVMMHIAPTLVRPLSEAGNGHARRPKIRAMREGWAWTPRRWTQVSSDTGVGNPARSSAEKGERYVAAAVERCGDFLADLARADIADLYAD